MTSWRWVALVAALLLASSLKFYLTNEHTMMMIQAALGVVMGACAYFMYQEERR